MAQNIVKYIMEVDSKGAVRSMNKLDGEVEEVNRDLKKTKKTGKDMGNSLTKSFKGLKAVMGALGVVVVAGAFKEASKAAFDFARASVDAINQLNDIGAKSGLSAEGVQATIMAFEGSGQAAAAAEGFMSRMPRTFADLSVSGTRASKAAEALGISLQDASGNAKSSDQLLSDLTLTFQGMENPTEKATAAFLLFGRSAGSFLQAFGGTTQRFKDFSDFTKEFGVNAEEGGQAAAKFQETLAAIEVVFDGARQSIMDTTGGVELFQNVLSFTGRSIVYFTGFLKHADTAFEILSGGIKETWKDLMDLRENVLLVISPIHRLIWIAEQLGIISDMSDGTKDSAVAFFDLQAAFDAGEAAAKRFDEQLKIVVGNVENTDEEVDQANERLRKLKETMGDTEGEEKQAKALSDLQSVVDDAEQSLLQLQVAIEDHSSTNTAASKRTNEYTRFMEELHDQLSLLPETLENITLFQAAAAAATELYLLDLGEIEKNEALKKQREDAENLKKEFDDLTSSVDTLITAFGSLTSGDMLGALGALATKLSGTALIAANAALAVLGIAQNIGSAGIQRAEAMGQRSDEAARREAKKDIEENMRNQARAIEIGLQVLPEILIGVLPGILMESTIRILDAILHLPHGIFLAIRDLFKSDTEIATVGTQEGRQRGSERWLGIITGFIQSFSLESGGRIPFAESGLRWTGNQSGLAQLHPGEYVVPRTGQAPQQVQRDLQARSSGGITINVNGMIVENSAIDSLVDRIEERFMIYGGNSSPLFQGG